jgi:hypothetical protein
MKGTYLILAFFSAFSFCQCNQKNSKDSKNVDSKIYDTAKSATASYHLKDIPSFDTNLSFVPDTKELKQKRKIILTKFSETYSPAGPTYDTLVDINYDGYRDYFIGWYGSAGSGFKYRITTYIFSPSKNNYLLNSQISDLVNPSFFIPEHKITGFYIGLGGGHGSKLEWIKGKWLLTKTFEVDNNGDSTIWEITYPLTKKTETIRMHFQVIPPDEVLESNHYF